MAGISDFLQIKMLEHSLGVNAYVMPGQVFCALFTSSPNQAGGGTEVNGGAYARQLISWNRAVGGPGSITNSANITFPAATTQWGTITSIGVFDAASGGNLLWFGNTDQARTVNISDVWVITAASLSIQLD